MHALTVRKIGNSTGIILPKELLQEIGAKEGDQLYITKTDEGHILKNSNPEVIQQMEIALSFMGDYKEALQILADK